MCKHFEVKRNQKSNIQKQKIMKEKYGLCLIAVMLYYCVIQWGCQDCGLLLYNFYLTPCPKALVKPPWTLWSVLKNWWVKCWAMNANIRFVPWGSGLNVFLLKNLSVNTLGSGRSGLPVGKEHVRISSGLQSSVVCVYVDLTFSSQRQRTVFRYRREESSVVGDVVVGFPAEVSIFGVVGRGAWNRVASNFGRTWQCIG